jgi:hypothetical protein
MKYRNIKLLIPIMSFVFTIGMTSCVDDLNVVPIDPSVTQAFYQDDVFTKIYASLGLTGQQGPAGKGDVAGIDEGFSDFYRLIWNLNELSTDEAICAWGDADIPTTNFCKWTSSHGFVTGMYGRFYFNITLCNHFLAQTAGLTDEKSIKQRAEARFMRAMNYYYLLDMFGNVPFTEVVSDTPAPQMLRADLFKYVEKELSECEVDMYEPKQAPYYRVDKVANWLIRSRLYLNAEVYTGTPRWADAAIYAKKVMDPTSGYSLCPTYKHLFMADNAGALDGSTVNKAPLEIIFPIAADGIKTQNWGSSLFLIASTHTADMTNWGSAGWTGNRARATLVKKFFPTGSTFFSDATDLTSAILASYKDNRALFNKSGRTLNITTVEKFKEGYSVIKFTNIRADGKPAHAPEKTDMDVPFLRAAEAYLTYAEAIYRKDSVANKTEALTVINQIRTRSNAQALVATKFFLPTILDEKCREFFFEGQRRTDLIRFGKFGGNTGYNWDWKGGLAPDPITGAPAAATFSVERNIFPIPSTDLNANPNLGQNPGYN